MDERRKYKRMRISDYLSSNKSTPDWCFQIFDGKSNQFIGHLADISAQGMMMLSSKPIEQDTELILKIELPEDTTDGQPLVVKARSLWWRQVNNQKYCKVGFKVENSSLDLAQVTKQLFDKTKSMEDSSNIPVTTV